MLKRAGAFILGIAVLSGSRMPLRLPCCSLRQLESAAVQSDCCPIPGCALAERSGPAAVIRDSLALERPTAAVPLAAPVPPMYFSSLSRRGPWPSTSPPRSGPTLSFLSIYRI